MVTADSLNAQQRPLHVARQRTPRTQTFGDKCSTLSMQSVGQVPPGDRRIPVHPPHRQPSKRRTRPMQAPCETWPTTNTRNHLHTNVSTLSEALHDYESFLISLSKTGHTGLAECSTTTASCGSTTDATHANIWGQMFYSVGAIRRPGSTWRSSRSGSSATSKTSQTKNAPQHGRHVRHGLRRTHANIRTQISRLGGTLHASTNRFRFRSAKLPTLRAINRTLQYPIECRLPHHRIHSRWHLVRDHRPRSPPDTLPSVQRWGS